MDEQQLENRLTRLEESLDYNRASTVYFCRVGVAGGASINYASDAGQIPLCFRVS